MPLSRQLSSVTHEPMWWVIIVAYLLYQFSGAFKMGMVVGVIGGVIAGLGGSNIVPVAAGVAIKCLGFCHLRRAAPALHG